MENQFRELCGQYFGFLVDDYSFKLESDDSKTMLFRRESVEIKITDCQMNNDPTKLEATVGAAIGAGASKPKESNDCGGCQKP